MSLVHLGKPNSLAAIHPFDAAVRMTRWNLFFRLSHWSCRTALKSLFSLSVRRFWMNCRCSAAFKLSTSALAGLDATSGIGTEDIRTLGNSHPLNRYNPKGPNPWSKQKKNGLKFIFVLELNKIRKTLTESLEVPPSAFPCSVSSVHGVWFSSSSVSIHSKPILFSRSQPRWAGNPTVTKA